MAPSALSCLVVTIILSFALAPQFVASADNEANPKVTPKIYASIFARRREEHKLFVKHLSASNYEKTYKMLDLAFEKILEIIKENNMTLHQSGYIPAAGFPTESRLQDAVALIIENICLGGDLILHFPDISYRVLRKYDGWKTLFDWGTKFLNFYAHILSEKTYEMIELLRQEMNLTKRAENFVNPYYEKVPSADSRSNGGSATKNGRKKPRKKLKRGPQLAGRLEL